MRASDSRIARRVSATSTATWGSSVGDVIADRFLACGPAALAADCIERRVHGGGVQPCRGTGARVITEAPVQVEKDVLGDVLSRSRVTEDAVRDRSNPRVLLREEPVEAGRGDARCPRPERTAGHERDAEALDGAGLDHIT